MWQTSKHPIPGTATALADLSYGADKPQMFHECLP
jgi:hypothetical protein